MKDELRFKLFSEIVGNDERNSIKNYDSILKGSEAYKILSYNIIDARKSRTRKAKALVYSFDNLTFKPKDVKNTFKLEIMLNYLALHSFPEYYLNPLAISPNYQGEVNSIGDLYIDYPKGDRTINSIIESQEETLSEKKEQIKKYIQYCKDDMSSIIQESLDTIQKSVFLKSDKKIIFLQEYLEDFLFICFNFFLVFFLIFPFEDFQNLYLYFRPDKVSGYIAWIYPLFTFFYDIIFIIFHSYKAKIMEPFNYARRFLKRSEFKIYQDVEQKGNALYDYIYGAVKNRIQLKNDILEFSMLSSSYIDYEAILEAEKKKRSRQFILLKNFLFSTSILEFLFLVAALFVYFFDLVFSTLL